MTETNSSEAFPETPSAGTINAGVPNAASRFDWLFDNPIIIKQTRVRLKRSSLFSWVAMLALLAMGHMWMEYQFGTQRYDRSAGYTLAGMIFFLLIIGSQQTGMLVGSTRASGMLDFHRLSPQSPSSMFAGFILGGPIREYMIFGVGSILFLAACAFYGTFLPGAILVLASILVMVLLFHGLSIVSAMLARTPNVNAAKGAGAAWGVIISMMFLGPLFSRAMAIDRLASDPFSFRYVGLRLPWYVVFMGLGAVAFVFFAIAGVRRLKDDIRPSLSKKQAIAAYFLAILAGLGFLSAPEDTIDSAILGGILIGICAFWVLLSFILIPTTAPERVAYIGGLRRSLRLGHRRPGPFEDRAVNRWAIAAMAGLLTIGISIATFIMSSGGEKGFEFPGASSATVVLVVIEFGLALQYFRLRLGKHAGGAMLLFIFVMWILPIIVGIMIISSGVANITDSAGFIAMSASPFPGVLLGSGVIDETGIDSKSCQLAALLPALTAVFVFNMLVSNLQKRIDKRILPEHSAADADPFAWLDQATPRELVSSKKPKASKSVEANRQGD
ncbi:hypothetical protein GC170_06715 [bacterium]|nr:hypothetical protein [bacterium]